MIAPHLVGANPQDQEEIDRLITHIDPSDQKSLIGGNAALGVSIASARLGAQEKQMPLWKHLREIWGESAIPEMPYLFANCINGGVHAGDSLIIQEYLAIPTTRSTRIAVQEVLTVFHALGSMLGRKKETMPPTGDEGGFAPNMTDPAEPLEYMEKAAKKAGIPMRWGIDAAANEIEGKTPRQLTHLYDTLIDRFNLHYIEDPFTEDAFDLFAALKKRYGEHVIIAGDDLTVSNSVRMAMAAKEGSVNGVIVKPNQIGTVTEAKDAAFFAKSRGWKAVASHRSGETVDSFIADFAVAIGAYGIKLGAPNRGERIEKYNRLMEIEGEIGV
jgi:enolase